MVKRGMKLKRRNGAKAGKYFGSQHQLTRETDSNYNEKCLHVLVIYVAEFVNG